jgi:hypothetical protein
MRRGNLLGAVATSWLVACGVFSSDAPSTVPDPSPDADADVDAASPTMALDGGGDATPRQPPVGAPPGCDPLSPPQTSPACIVDEFGIFVDPAGGDDAQPGSKAAPAKTIAGALGKLGGRRRVYLCDGALDEHVKLTVSADLYGGFACQTWAYTGTKTRVAPKDAGFALEIQSIADPVTIVDMAFSAVDGTDASPTSVAAFVKASPMVTLRRVALEAKNGFSRSAGATGTPGTNNGGGPGLTCTCSNGGTSTGGPGGAKGAIGAPSNPGSAGGPAQGTPTPAGADGAGVASGSVGDRGSDANGVGGIGTGANHPYDVMGDMLVAVPGGDGSDGPVGQGGGGSASTQGISTAVPSLPGRGGGCGGCGGNKGLGGLGGGASIALLAFDAPVQLDTCALTSGSGGHGGDGGGGGGGGGGGAGAPGVISQSNSKAGGAGGTGGVGGSGGGGAGGVTAGIVYKGPVITVPPTTTIATGGLGTKGAGGTPGTNDGVDGPKMNVLVLP